MLKSLNHPSLIRPRKEVRKKCYLDSASLCPRKARERRLRPFAPKHGQQLQHACPLTCGIIWGTCGTCCGICIPGPCGYGIYGICCWGICCIVGWTDCCGTNIWLVWVQHIGGGWMTIGGGWQHILLVTWQHSGGSGRGVVVIGGKVVVTTGIGCGQQQHLKNVSLRIRESDKLNLGFFLKRTWEA